MYRYLLFIRYLHIYSMYVGISYVLFIISRMLYLFGSDVRFEDILASVIRTRVFQNAFSFFEKNLLRFLDCISNVLVVGMVALACYEQF